MNPRRFSNSWPKGAKRTPVASHAFPSAFVFPRPINPHPRKATTHDKPRISNGCRTNGFVSSFTTKQGKRFSIRRFERNPLPGDFVGRVGISHHRECH